MKVILMMAMTLDGKIAKNSGHFANWTSQADKKSFVAETKAAGVILMGRQTYETIGRPLPGRLNIVMTQSPEKFESMPGELEYTNLSPEKVLEELATRGFETLILGGGSKINSLFLEKGLINELLLTIEPKLFGNGLSLFKDIDIDLDLELLEINSLSDNVLQLRYKVLS